MTASTAIYKNCTALSRAVLLYPEIFKTEKVDVTVDLDDVPGKTWVKFTKNGNVNLVTALNREKFLEILDRDLQNMNHIKLNIER